MMRKEILRSIVFILICLTTIYFPANCLASDELNTPPLLGPPVTALILVNADTDQDIEEINEGDVFFLADIGTSNLSVRAEVGPNTESVVFAYQGISNYKLENIPVYAIAGDSRNDYNAWLPDLGANVITVTAYSGDNRTGLAGEPFTVNFQVLEASTTPPEPGTNLPAVVRINSGGPTVTYGDSTFIADEFFAGNGSGYSKNFLPEIFGTTQDDIYKSERRANGNLQSFTYNIPVTNGAYSVNLHFAETFFGAIGGGAGGTGKRIFNVTLEGQAILTNFDINARVSPMTALIETFTTTVTDESLDLTFSASVNQPKVSAIEVYGEGSLITEAVDVGPQLGPPVTALILVNADTDQDIEEINNGDVFFLADIGTSNLSVRAEVGPNTESVVFAYQGISNYKLENIPVYAIGGDSRNDYNAWVPDLGANVISATAFTRDSGTGLAGEPLTVNFQVSASDTGTIPQEPGTTLPAVVRINSGGPTITYGDSTFIADEFFEGNGSGSARNFLPEIFGTTQDNIYKSERRANGNLQSFTYNIPVTNGAYSVNLHFAETYFGATGGGAGGTGKRVFNVTLEGQAILTNFDINAQVSPMTALIETFTTTVTDQSLDLTFSGSVNQAKVSAVEVYGTGSLINDPTSCTWNTLASSSLSKIESQSVKVNGKLYVLAGFLAGLKITAATEIYDPNTNTWTFGTPMPTPVTHMAAVAVGDEIWVLAGFVGNNPGIATNLVQIYNTTTHTWSTGPALPNPRGSVAAAYSDGKIYFFGGLLPDRVTDVGEHYVFDVNDQASGWKALAPMPQPRNHHSAAAVNGIIYAIGGQFGHDNGVDDQSFLHAYDPNTDTWTQKANLRSDRSHFEPGTMVHNNKIIIVGGRKGAFFFDDVTEYDPATDSWSERCQLPHSLLAPSAKIFGDQLIVANGGKDGICCPQNETISIAVEPEVTTVNLRTENEADFRELVYHETTGHSHESINAGIEMMEDFGIVIYPNPVNDILTVNSSSDLPMQLKLVSLTGTILKEKSNVFQSEIDVSGLKPGIYILIVNKGEIYERIRVIKK